MKARNVLTATYEFNDDPLTVTEIDGLLEAVREVAEAEGGERIVEADRVPDYKVYWNSKTETVRIGALVMGASWEVTEEELDKQTLADFDEAQDD
jgi:hypothetical protein